MYSIKEQLLALHHSRHVTPSSLQKIILLHKQFFPNQDLLSIVPKINLSPVITKEIEKDFHHYFEQRTSEVYSQQKIKAITIYDEQYPEFLKEIPDPPPVLYVKGIPSLLKSSSKRLSVVGSRTPTEYGIKVLHYLLPPLIQAGFIIVSGLAKGIDRFAHETAIQSGGQTIAVLGNGFEHTYPAENKKLSAYIGTHHLLVSEYTPPESPKKWHFPARNRIISGLSVGTLIIEGKYKSGSLITAYSALEQGREVFAVPGQILHPNSEGPHRLIKEGAKLVAHPDDVLEELIPFI
ncbi:DNA processing protein [Bacillus oleivorans]|uniref:DNA processing protein n=1 Tax=Bacillus oleivorans TaxID=1448271 RepID=A0A285D351_9BACI|nr:DNA-processing protein DprA [Bacillus oleivorans]SNX73613.1 DNA processing protein [Bacillus oleivorans]